MPQPGRKRGFKPINDWPTTFPNEREDEQSHRDFISEVWPEAAAKAWECYLTQGRGAFVIDAREVAKANTGMSVGAYVTEELAQQNMDGWPDEKTAEYVRSYDPETQIVFIIRRLDGGISAYRSMRYPPSPREAYMQKAN